jgi:hypothetical protein
LQASQPFLPLALLTVELTEADASLPRVILGTVAASLRTVCQKIFEGRQLAAFFIKFIKLYSATLMMH